MVSPPLRSPLPEQIGVLEGLGGRPLNQTKRSLMWVGSADSMGRAVSSAHLCVWSREGATSPHPKTGLWGSRGGHRAAALTPRSSLPGAREPAAAGSPDAGGLAVCAASHHPLHDLTGLCPPAPPHPSHGGRGVGGQEVTCLERLNLWDLSARTWGPLSTGPRATERGDPAPGSQTVQPPQCEEPPRPCPVSPIDAAPVP